MYRMQIYDSVMYGYSFIEFIDFTSKGKSLTDFTNLFSRLKLGIFWFTSDRLKCCQNFLIINISERNQSIS